MQFVKPSSITLRLTLQEALINPLKSAIRFLTVTTHKTYKKFKQK